MFYHWFLSNGILRNLVLIALRYHEDDQISEINMVTVKTVEPSAVGWYTSTGTRQIFTSSYQPDRLTESGENVLI